MKKIKINEKKYRAEKIQLKRHAERLQKIKVAIQPINQILKNIKCKKNLNCV